MGNSPFCRIGVKIREDVLEHAVELNPQVAWPCPGFP